MMYSFSTQMNKMPSCITDFGITNFENSSIEMPLNALLLVYYSGSLSLSSSEVFPWVSVFGAVVSWVPWLLINSLKWSHSLHLGLMRIACTFEVKSWRRTFWTSLTLTTFWSLWKSSEFSSSSPSHSYCWYFSSSLVISLDDEGWAFDAPDFLSPNQLNKLF